VRKYYKNTGSLNKNVTEVSKYSEEQEERIC